MLRRLPFLRRCHLRQLDLGDALGEVVEPLEDLDHLALEAVDVDAVRIRRRETLAEAFREGVRPAGDLLLHHDGLRGELGVALRDGLHRQLDRSPHLDVQLPEHVASRFAGLEPAAPCLAGELAQVHGDRVRDRVQVPGHDEQVLHLAQRGRPRRAGAGPGRTR